MVNLDWTLQLVRGGGKVPGFRANQLGGCLLKLNKALTVMLPSLLCAGGATPTPSFFEALVALKQLHVLEVLPGVYGQIAGYDMDVGQGDADSHPIGHMGVGDAHLAAIGKLTQLQQVTVKVGCWGDNVLFWGGGVCGGRGKGASFQGQGIDAGGAARSVLTVCWL